ncbi:hypothetical protein Arcpr_0851 [Archaeoglobus profundus DSM 5631]|uniref:Uncharacterized protein n=1 Tax=Archaeoglobus profundus (strain DSM 5631 / JCM 9629 / NBRC 100127 / Av18) TaxID=572546 RepID=D2RHY9_ARCPA|nr:hypothetical protein [Archaeoglobus profundus]ADB57914.1 hypothetical protein Arcpr_0851 [Archaeoglobus profundus DSM 5631]
MTVLADLPFPVKLLIAIGYDVLDALNVIPLIGDFGEGIAGGSIAFLLTGNWKAGIISAVDGFLTPPLDFLPTTTAIVIADKLGWLE